MSEEQKELFRKAVLRVLDANRTRYGLGLSAVGHLLGQFGFVGTQMADMEEAVEYLGKKDLVEECLKVVSGANRTWRITQKGMAFVDEQM